MRFLIPLVLAFTIAAPAQAAEDTRLLRFPDVWGGQVAFVYGGDIYTVSTAGGVAQRLTSDEGQELYPKFSPDGEWIAFSAEYTGTRQVWVMPAAGGTPRQLTFYTDVGPMPPRGGTDYRILDWTPDGQHVLVRANRTPHGERDGVPILVPFAGGMEQPLGPPETGGGMLSADGNTYVYTPIDREFRTWKRHRGGRAQDVWTYDLVNDTSRRLTDFVGTDHQPLWVDGRIYFVSDRDFTLNLFAMDMDGGNVTKVTTFDEFDVLWPSSDRSRIVFENGGYIWLHDPATAQTTRIPIQVTGDRPHALPAFKNVSDNIESFDIAPQGERAVFGARGEIFTVPAQHGEIRNISRTPAAREISVAWSPDGRWISYLSDATGEYELYVRPQDGGGEPKQVTKDGQVWRFPPVWAPDSKKLAFADSDNRLSIVEVESGRVRVVDTTRFTNNAFRNLTQYTWSPDSAWLAYTKVNESFNSSIWVYSLASGEATQLTTDATNEQSPAFDPKGRYLYFTSTRDWNLVFSSYEFNYLYNNATRLYAATLAADGPALNRPRSDEVTPVAADKEESKDEDKDKKGKPEPVRFDLAGFNERVTVLDAPAANYVGLTANEGGLFFISAQQGNGNELRYYDLEKREAQKVLDGVTGYALSADGKKLLWRQRDKFGIADAKPEVDAGKTALKLEGMEMLVDPRVEWQQMYVDGWRILRDWFWDPGHHGQDWEAIRDRYAPLVDHVAHRADLDYIFGELGGELNAGHIYVNSSPGTPGAERKPGGLLGAHIEPHESGYFRIARIFPGENWHDYYRSPLTEAGVNASAGDFILAVDGVSTQGVDNFYRLLQNKGDRVVELTLNDRASERGARVEKVKTVTSETPLRYLEWVTRNRERVHELSGGRVGYIHVPNTAVEGNRELFKGMLAEARRDALIIDDRYNGGGFIPDRMIEMLARTPLNYWVWRGFEPQPRPLLSHDGPKAMLINGLASSGGDALPYYFRKLELGPLIGTRTWGGLIGISGNPGLADGGSIIPATFRFLDTEGNWAVEDEGVAPDIEVIDRPEAIAAGRDPSLEKAVEVMLEALEANPPRRIETPPAPTDFRFR
ncbi:S41 family peptidase [Thioalkalivibrio sp. XN279]|uniref:S41 family peptidase n=1 Tax=Thioalkalivibrio sp. XN279 TaxID=2714953 RepID=UPI00140CD817|nr:S41 family peptidase [Thioalkalivibrio sp. XN279]NHA14905.1 protease [Thioalkalivibrio sp. XN279]